MINIKLNKCMAFSLIEVLMSILLVSMLLIVVATSVAKKPVSKTHEGVVFTYNPTNNTETQDVCFTTSSNPSSSYAETYTTTYECSEYTFQVPNNVDTVNLTLVAGGGGGGGAAGGSISEYTITSETPNSGTNTTTASAVLEFVKNIKINMLTAKGQNGGNFVKNSEGITGGKGGNSSPVLFNFYIPKTIMRGLNFAKTLVINTTSKQLLSLTTNQSKSYIQIAGGVTYQVAKDGTNYTYDCSLSDQNDCLIPSSSIIDSVPGAAGTFAPYNEYIPLNTPIAGGKGGKNNISFEYGAGGEGQQAKAAHCPNSGTLAQSCSVVITEFTSGQDAQSGGKGFASATYQLEYPGGTGGGGASGTVVRILNMPVTSGETYTIRVGKGGKGGAAGITSKSATAGAEGKGGVSTAIYKGADLVYMVNGGAGGKGGLVNASSAPSASSFGKDGRNIAKVFSKASAQLTSMVLDTDIARKASSNSTSTKPSNFALQEIEYPLFDKEPYKTLNLNGMSASTNGRKYGGFTNFEKSSPVYYTGTNNIYDGFYYRTLLEKNPAYIGGLGGFSPIYPKAACGAYFMGNFDGREDADGTVSEDETTRASKINKFVLSSKVVYDVFDYYENCNALNSNGTTSDFIYPSPSDSYYGKAGLGGGGGGYNQDNGSGHGGSGTNGYLMIDWYR